MLALESGSFDSPVSRSMPVSKLSFLPFFSTLVISKQSFTVFLHVSVYFASFRPVRGFWWGRNLGLCERDLTLSSLEPTPRHSRTNFGGFVKGHKHPF